MKNDTTTTLENVTDHVLSQSAWRANIVRISHIKTGGFFVCIEMPICDAVLRCDTIKTARKALLVIQGDNKDRGTELPQIQLGTKLCLNEELKGELLQGVDGEEHIKSCIWHDCCTFSPS